MYKTKKFTKTSKPDRHTERQWVEKVTIKYFLTYLDRLTYRKTWRKTERSNHGKTKESEAETQQHKNRKIERQNDKMTERQKDITTEKINKKRSKVKQTDRKT